MLKKFIILIIIGFLFSSCTTLEGIGGINTTDQQIEIEKKLTQGTDLENVTISSSVITAINNLEQLQIELTKLNYDIENINYELNKIANNDNLNQETIDYLNQLNELTKKSSLFVNELEKSTQTWESYLIEKNTSNLNFTDDSSQIINSVEAPLKVFEE